MWQCPISSSFISFQLFNYCLHKDTVFMNMLVNHIQTITFLLILIHRFSLLINFEVDFGHMIYSIFFSKPSPAYQLSFNIILVQYRGEESNLLMFSLACTQCKKCVIFLSEIFYFHKYILNKLTVLAFSFPQESFFCQLLSPQPFSVFLLSEINS